MFAGASQPKRSLNLLGNVGPGWNAPLAQQDGSLNRAAATVDGEQALFDRDRFISGSTAGTGDGLATGADSCTHGGKLTLAERELSWPSASEITKKYALLGTLLPRDVQKHIGWMLLDPHTAHQFQRTIQASTFAIAGETKLFKACEAAVCFLFELSKRLDDKLTAIGAPADKLATYNKYKHYLAELTARIRHFDSVNRGEYVYTRVTHEIGIELSCNVWSDLHCLLGKIGKYRSECTDFDKIKRYKEPNYPLGYPPHIDICGGSIDQPLWLDVLHRDDEPDVKDNIELIQVFMQISVEIAAAANFMASDQSLSADDRKSAFAFGKFAASSDMTGAEREMEEVLSRIGSDNPHAPILRDLIARMTARAEDMDEFEYMWGARYRI